ncbi:hypothetical protein NEMBOFW57_009529 [Staphylotrichum longicolle]|uniref:Uncharacterized protein n=1 Tax=Staphylotrichum longicolle TaxID=669026 RepID=A0AAD4HTG7_9PEZI|nr:hypothetical protein NEMBOFW57_009529 [Staphylotrichum longicolle]
MTVQQQLRISEADGDSINALLQDYLNSAIEEEGNEQPFVAPGTQAERNRVWIAWTKFVFPPARPGFPNAIQISTSRLGQFCGKIDPYRFWVDFARNPSSAFVQAPVQAFLHQYVVNSEKERVVLGPEERAMIRTLNSAYSVIEVWRRLVASADFKVLRGERRALRAREKYLEAERLFLRWEQEDSSLILEASAHPKVSKPSYLKATPQLRANMRSPPPEILATWPKPNYVNPETRGPALAIVELTAIVRLGFVRDRMSRLL